MLLLTSFSDHEYKGGEHADGLNLLVKSHSNDFTVVIPMEDHHEESSSSKSLATIFLNVSGHIVAMQH